MTEKRTRVDWDALEPHYRAGIRALKDIGREFGVSDAGIIKHARDAGWTRNLKAKIQAQADAKVSAALVAAEKPESPAKVLTEAVRVEVEAEVQARVRISHRTDINRAKSLTNRYLSALEGFDISEAPADDTRAAVKAGAPHRAVLPLKEHVAMLAKLTEVQKTQVTMEREAYGIAHLQEDPDRDGPVIDPVEGARRLAFALANAGAILSQRQGA